MKKNIPIKILDHIPDLFLTLDKGGVVLSVQGSRIPTFFLITEGLVGKSLDQVLPFHIAETARASLLESVDSGVEKSFEFSPDNSDRQRHFEGRMIPVKKDQALFVIRDISQKVLTPKSVEDSEEQYRHLFEHNPVPMLVLDMETLGFLNVNAAAVNHYGYSREEFLSLTIRDIRPLEDVEAAVRLVQSVQEKVAKVGIWRHLKKDGTVILVDIHSHEILYEGKSARLVLCNDVTEQVQAREDLEESEKKFRTLFVTSPDAVTVSDLENGVLLEVNEGFLALTGYRRDEVIGKSSVELELWADPEQRADLVERIRSEKMLINYEATMRMKDASERTFLLSAQTIHLSGVPRLLTVSRDITEIIKARQALEGSEEKFRAAFETIPDSILIVDPKERIIKDINQGFVTTTGYLREEVLGRSSDDVGLWEDVADRDRFYEAVGEEGVTDGFEAGFRLKDGSISRGLLSARTLNLSGRPHLLITVRDITSLMEAHQNLRASLDEKEVLLREVHHRVKNNLQVVSGLLDLQSHNITDPETQAVNKESQSRIMAMALIHEELYQSTDLSRVHFGHYIRTLCNNLMTSYGVREGRIDLKIDTRVTEMIMDTAIPCGLIINELVTNALKHAFPDGRKGHIHLSFRQHPDTRKEREGESYELVVKDDGVGIPDDLDIGNMRSLGLKLVRALAEQLGGGLEMSGKDGTCFRIVFKEYYEAGTVLY